jgi:hypothetical protein
VELGNGYQAAIRTTKTRVLKLRQVLGALGVEIPETTAQFDVPLDSLRVGSTEIRSYEKAKKRAGMREMLDSICEVKTRSALMVGKPKKKGDEETE